MENQDTTNMVCFIDKFIVPKASVTAFIKQVEINRRFIAQLPGYIRGEAFESSDSESNVTIITIAVWQNQQLLDDAKLSVQQEFKRLGFDPVPFYQRLQVQVERKIFYPLRRPA
ncbi:hypothetical protein MKQ68_04380 [Chitinophaga horti]|uniref:Antibiotic biosynthesis monooxygenase n=1 Tax=Chitinophaga horti TaxID=2920382 RepID=A0ABY6J6U9_9BACT|nr:hypothetical protein [Chitinophaga horti]UYQ94327.1 hypothetical protein MKQ68_04380 [Chitinophaga horti]